MKFDKIYEQICEKLLDKSNEENLEEVAPPGEEDLVLALKKQKGVKIHGLLLGASTTKNTKNKNKMAQISLRHLSYF